MKNTSLDSETCLESPINNISEPDLTGAQCNVKLQSLENNKKKERKRPKRCKNAPKRFGESLIQNNATEKHSCLESEFDINVIADLKAA